MSKLLQKLLLFPTVLGLAASCGGGTSPSTSEETVSGSQPLTCESLSRVVDLQPGSTGSSPSLQRVYGGALYFYATRTDLGTELWKTDGTAAGTVLVSDINPGAAGSSPFIKGELNGVLLLSANDGVRGEELWKTDGTAAGTVLVKDIYPGTGSSSVVGLGVLNGALLLKANDGVNGAELWKTDGTAAGTVLVKNIYGSTCAGKTCPASSGSSDISSFMVREDGVALFLATNGVHGKELWRTDGTAAGTVLVKDINPGSATSISSSFTVLMNGTYYFGATDGVNGEALWKSDGTAAGTVLVKDISPGTGTSTAFGPLHLVNGTLFFGVDDGVHGYELWKSDGTPQGTVLVYDHPAGQLVPGGMMAVGSEILLLATPTGAVNHELWKTDGTAAGTVFVSDPNANRALNNCGFGFCTPSMSLVSALGGVGYFFADDGLSGYELWRTDGTAAGTRMVQDLNPGPGDALLTGVPSRSMYNGELYFNADDGVSGVELWKASQQPCP